MCFPCNARAFDLPLYLEHICIYVAMSIEGKDCTLGTSSDSKIYSILTCNKVAGDSGCADRDDDVSLGSPPPSHWNRALLTAPAITTSTAAALSVTLLSGDRQGDRHIDGDRRSLCTSPVPSAGSGWNPPIPPSDMQLPLANQTDPLPSADQDDSEKVKQFNIPTLTLDRTPRRQSCHIASTDTR